mmetsp:Transcript_202/g.658  ORF Transcript_202/g.658 Transcript_202/m.658 type:complete len:291 (-) Transcript_202:243-1115(-)
MLGVGIGPAQFTKLVRPEALTPDAPSVTLSRHVPIRHRSRESPLTMRMSDRLTALSSSGRVTPEFENNVPLTAVRLAKDAKKAPIVEKFPRRGSEPLARTVVAKVVRLKLLSGFVRASMTSPTLKPSKALDACPVSTIPAKSPNAASTSVILPLELLRRLCKSAMVGRGRASGSTESSKTVLLMRCSAACSSVAFTFPDCRSSASDVKLASLSTSRSSVMFSGGTTVALRFVRPLISASIVVLAAVRSCEKAADPTRDVTAESRQTYCLQPLGGDKRSSRSALVAISKNC